jgi:hypothetical protein
MVSSLPDVHSGANLAAAPATRWRNANTGRGEGIDATDLCRGAEIKRYESGRACRCLRHFVQYDCDASLSAAGVTTRAASRMLATTGDGFIHQRQKGSHLLELHLHAGSSVRWSVRGIRNASLRCLVESTGELNGGQVVLLRSMPSWRRPRRDIGFAGLHSAPDELRHSRSGERFCRFRFSTGGRRRQMLFRR